MVKARALQGGQQIRQTFFGAKLINKAKMIVGNGQAIETGKDMDGFK